MGCMYLGASNPILSLSAAGSVLLFLLACKRRDIFTFSPVVVLVLVVDPSLPDGRRFAAAVFGLLLWLLPREPGPDVPEDENDMLPRLCLHSLTRH